jgi:intracellular multiplication protein IcmB
MPGKIFDAIVDTIDGFLSWASVSFNQTAETYCMLESAETETTFTGKDGSLISVIKINGVTYLVGPEEFERIHRGFTETLQTSLSRSGHAVQIYFQHDKATVRNDLANILGPARKTAVDLELNLADLFQEKVDYLSEYCASEAMYLVLWTKASNMTETQAKQSAQNKLALIRKHKIPPFRNTQNFLAGIPELRDAHNSFVKTTKADLSSLGMACEILDVHTACRAIRMSVDPDFTALNWQATLPGDVLPMRNTKNYTGSISDLLWPPLSRQLIPRDGENLDLRTARIGDRVYSSVFVDLFPKDVAPFVSLFRRMGNTEIPWRISYLLESDGMKHLGVKSALAGILSFAANQNKLINGAIKVLRHYKDNTDEALVRLKVTITTWAAVGEETLLRSRAAELAKAVQGWGYTEVSEVSGDAYAGVLSSALGLSTQSVATAAVAPLSDVIYMIPLTRPSSPWNTGAVLFRSPDGKPWPYQPGSSLQTTWIDLIYARPGSGKSVLSNSINLALCLQGGITRLPRIAIIDIGPSSSGLISLIKESLPEDKKHLVAHHRLRMVKEMAINPFDTQLGCRFPTAQERAFLVNFLTLLATPVGQDKSYDGIADMAGLIVEELYKNLADDAAPNRYTANLEPEVDKKITELNIKLDKRTTWWEITDELFKHDLRHLAGKAQRHAMPLLADAASICRTKPVEDLYGTIMAATGESIINAFGRMISSAVRDYILLSQITTFDLGEARIVSLDLDEVAKTGGEAADRQTAVMYMLARYVLARHYYLTEESIAEFPALYREYHGKRVYEIREDPKRIVFDEFHRTSKAKAVRDQVIVDMREGRKWKVQVALLSQSLDDFDDVMIEFATAIFIMDAGPKQAVDKSTKVFGLSDTARLALETRVHGPKLGGATFIAQFATKSGINTQLITSTIGPIELWAFNTTAEDTRIRNALYNKIGATKARQILAQVYPSGTATKEIEKRLNITKEQAHFIADEDNSSIIEEIIAELVKLSE